MSIPLDRLYHYIESVAQDVYGDTIIYHFYPHGSKNADNLTPISNYPEFKILSSPQILCHDQEPLDYNLYQDFIHYDYRPFFTQRSTENNINFDLSKHFRLNLRKNPFNMFDQCVLLHSERNSTEVDKYSANGFIPAYYWSHALIAQDWFRYAQHIKPHTQSDLKTDFLIYNRAWTGTREYRLKFAELLVKHDLIKSSQTSLRFYEDQCHYSNHVYQNPIWKPSISLDSYYKENNTHSWYSADFDITDYESTRCEVVLETLFDTQRLYLTEKTLRPIALGHPFLLCGPAGSLDYLKSYGFETFDCVIDESYDLIDNPMERMESIINSMTIISQWDTDTKRKKFLQLKEITDFNKKYFFSNRFFNLIVDELKTNLCQSIEHLVKSNTYDRCIDLNQNTYNDSNYLQWQSQNVKPYLVECNNLIYSQLINLKTHNK